MVKGCVLWIYEFFQVDCLQLSISILCCYLLFVFLITVPPSPRKISPPIAVT